MSNGKKLMILIMMLAAGALYAIIYLVPGVTGVLQKTEIVHYGEIKVSQAMTFYIVRDEKVYLSEKTGDINYYYEEGAQVRKGTRILEVTARSVEDENSYEEILERLGGSALPSASFNTEFHGLVSYHIDGYEGFFVPEAIPSISREEVLRLDPTPENLTRKTVVAGEPLYKICDHTSWYILGWVEKGEVSKFNVGANVTVEMPEGTVKAVVDQVRADGDWWQIVLSTSRYYEKFTEQRTGEATIITANAAGILVSNDSITTDEEGRIGVYVRKKDGDFAFTPIRIINSDGIWSAVEASYFYDEKGQEVNTIDVYDEVRRNVGSG
jgi:putative membrane fusion protein